MLGDILRAEREKRGLTLKDIEQETSIRSIYIEAIENGNYKALPGAVYARGFVRNYAQLLELNADELVQMFKDETQENTAPAESEDKAKTKPREQRKPLTVKKERNLFSSGDDFHERVEKSHRTQNILVAAAVVVLAFVGAIYYFFGEDPEAKKVADKPATQTEQQKPVSQSVPAVAKPGEKAPASANQNGQNQQQNMAKPDAKQQPATNVPMSAPQSMGSGEISVAAQFTKRCWTQVISDGKTIFEGTIEPG